MLTLFPSLLHPKLFRTSLFGALSSLQSLSLVRTIRIVAIARYVKRSETLEFGLP
jgi:hypothetical protein